MQGRAGSGGRPQRASGSEAICSRCSRCSPFSREQAKRCPETKERSERGYKPRVYARLTERLSRRCEKHSQIERQASLSLVWYLATHVVPPHVFFSILSSVLPILAVPLNVWKGLLCELPLIRNLTYAVTRSFQGHGSFFLF